MAEKRYGDLLDKMANRHVWILVSAQCQVERMREMGVLEGGGFNASDHEKMAIVARCAHELYSHEVATPEEFKEALRTLEKGPSESA